MRFAPLVSLAAFLLAATFVAGWEFGPRPKPAYSVTMTGDADAEIFVCAELKPGELTCLDLPTYVERVRAAMGSDQKADM